MVISDLGNQIPLGNFGNFTFFKEHQKFGPFLGLFRKFLLEPTLGWKPNEGPILERPWERFGWKEVGGEFKGGQKKVNVSWAPI